MLNTKDIAIAAAIVNAELDADPLFQAALTARRAERNTDLTATDIDYLIAAQNALKEQYDALTALLAGKRDYNTLKVLRDTCGASYRPVHCEYLPALFDELNETRKTREGA
jgi:predicted lipoprotein